jgi:tetratricopeptide (TPR) repeat protein
LTQIKFFDTADKVIEDIEDPFQFALAAVRLANGYDKEGREAEATDLLSQAVEISREEKVYGELGNRVRDSLLLELWRFYLARENFREANKLVSSVSSVIEQRRALAEIGRAATRVEADDVVLQAANAIDEPTAKATYWLAISEATDNSEKAESSISKALASAEAIDLPYEQCLVLSAIGVRQIGTGQAEQGRALLTRSVETIRDIEGSYRQTLCLLNLSHKFHTIDLEPNQEEQLLLREIVVQLE